MKINYTMNNREYRRYFNLARGILAEKRKIKRNKLRRVHSYLQIIIRNYLLCIFLFFILVFFDTLETLSYFEDILIFLMLLLLLVTTFLFLFYFVSYFKNRFGANSGEIRLDSAMIMNTTENGKVVTRSWKEIDLVYILEKVIFIFSKRTVFIIPISFQEQIPFLESLKEIRKEYSSLKIIDTVHEYYPNESKLKIFFFNCGIYILLILFSFIVAVGWEAYNLVVLNKEMQKIYDHNFLVEEGFYSYGKYRIVEKELKKFFEEFAQAYEVYNENSATGITYILSINYLEKHREDLKDVLQEFPAREKKTEKSIEKILLLLNEEKSMQNILKWNLGEFYENLFYEYAVEVFNDQYRKEWQLAIYNNQLKMQYLSRMIEILTLPNACWTIEEDGLYFCNDAQLNEYNSLYDLLMEDQKDTNGIKL